VLIWGPIAAYLALTGSWVKAIVLASWGGLAVGTIDNLLYPKLVGSQMRLPTVVIFFAIIGGVALFGPAGLILGPLAVAITMALLDVWWERTAGGQGAEEAVVEELQSAPPSSAIQEEPAEPVRSSR
jgi:predicted PurR-regulated permease PerM